MKYLQSSFTMPQFQSNPDFCCEKCVFGRGEHSTWCTTAEARALRFKADEQIILNAVERVFGVRLTPLIAPSDCEFCTPEDCGDFEAVGYLGGPNGRAICLRCLEAGRYLSGAHSAGDTPEEANG